MDPSNQPQQSNDSVPEWFREAIAPPTPPPPTPPTRINKRIIIIAAAAILIVAGVGVTAFLLSAKSTSCLTNTDYKDLTGVSLASALSPTESFYAEYVLFNDDTNQFDDSSDDGIHGNVLIQKIASFYKSRSNKPIVITLSGSYFATASETLASERIAAVQSSLVAAGIPTGGITVEGANLITPEDALEGDETSGETTIAITSDLSCR